MGSDAEKNILLFYRVKTLSSKDFNVRDSILIFAEPRSGIHDYWNY